MLSCAAEIYSQVLMKWTRNDINLFITLLNADNVNHSV